MTSPPSNIASPQTAKVSKCWSNFTGNKVYSAAAKAHHKPQNRASGVRVNVPKCPPVTSKKVPKTAKATDRLSIRRGHFRVLSATQAMMMIGWRYWITVAVGALLYRTAKK